MSETEFVWMSQDLDGETHLVQIPKRAVGHYLARGFSEAAPPPRRQRPEPETRKPAPKPSKKAEPSAASGPAPSEGDN